MTTMQAIAFGWALGILTAAVMAVPIVLAAIWAWTRACRAFERAGLDITIAEPTGSN